VIAVGNALSALALKTATTTIPIVSSANEDPVRLGLVTSLARPSGNARGVNFFTTELAGKRLELLRELVPGATRVAVFVNPALGRCAAGALPPDSRVVSWIRSDFPPATWSYNLSPAPQRGAFLSDVARLPISVVRTATSQMRRLVRGGRIDAAQKFPPKQA
jgi:ABC transporter substrate binding protein